MCPELYISYTQFKLSCDEALTCIKIVIATNCLLHPLAVLIYRIPNPANRSVVYIISILQDCKCADFPDESGKQAWCLLSIVSGEHEVITKLREICLDSLPRLSIRLKCWSPILHVRAIWNFQLDAYRRKQICEAFIFGR